LPSRRIGRFADSPRCHRRARLGPLLAAITLAAGLGATVVRGQTPTSDRLRIGGDAAFNWSDGSTRVLMVEGNVTLRADDTTLSADRAVIWLSNATGDAGDYRAEIALLGNPRVTRGDVTREGGELFVTIATRPDVQLETASLTPGDRSQDVNYLTASQLRRRAAAEPATPPAPAQPSPRQPRATTLATTRPERRPGPPVTFQAGVLKGQMTPEGRVALVLTGDAQSADVLLVQTRGDNSRIELQARSVVIFTRLTDARQILQGGRLGELAAEDIEAAYLEGDVRIAMSGSTANPAEQTLRASRVVYEFGSDRALLTDVLLHSYDPTQPAPLVVRADAMRQLGVDTFEADRASITTSNFATPSLALSASKVTVRQAETGDPRVGTRTSFLAENVTPRSYGVPFFYFPRLWGSMTEGGGIPLRDAQVSATSGFGVGLETTWGLFETLGRRPPEGTDATYRLDYFSERGPAFGLDSQYAGGFVSETTLQPWSFAGDFTSYLVYDDGEDRLGKRRQRIEHDGDLRGRIRWNHQHFLADGWQVQARVGYVSDETFLEEWFRNEFRNGQPHETSLYVKRTVGNEVFSVFGNVDLNNVPTVADEVQEVYVNDGDRIPLIVERLPEVAYHRLGESLADDRLTLVSNNSIAGLHFSESYASHAELGLRNRRVDGDDLIDESFAGCPHTRTPATPTITSCAATSARKCRCRWATSACASCPTGWCGTPPIANPSTAAHRIACWEAWAFAHRRSSIASTTTCDRSCWTSTACATSSSRR
jgi:hypothetical protein